MNYAKITNRPLITQKKVATSKKVSSDAQSIRKFCQTHSVSITVNPNTKEGIAVLKRDDV